MKSRRWKTWAKHAVISFVAVVVGSLLVGKSLWLVVGVGGFYTVREAVQQMLRDKEPPRSWLGIFGDVASAWIGGTLVWWLL